MYKKIIGLILAVTAVFAAQTVLANSCHCGEKLEKMVNALNLTSDQKDKIKPIFDQLKSTMKDKWTQIKDIKMQMDQQSAGDEMDVAVINGLIDKKMALMGDIMKAKASAKAQIMDILTDKQKMQIKAKMAEVKAKMAKKWHQCQHDD